jgi:hypothetical protein
MGPMLVALSCSCGAALRPEPTVRNNAAALNKLVCRREIIECSSSPLITEGAGKHNSMFGANLYSSAETRQGGWK